MESKQKDDVRGSPQPSTSRNTPSPFTTPTSAVTDNSNYLPRESNKPFEVSGRRIVELKSFFEAIINFKHHSLFKCGAENLKIINEQRIGLISRLFVECCICKEVSTIFTDKCDSDYVDVNKVAVLGTVSTGGGHSQLEEFLAICDIPCMCFRTFSSCQNEIAPHIYETVYDTILSAGREEAQLAKEAGDVDIDGIPKITVIADGAWCKRSYKSNYNAASGVGVIIGQRTKKILFLGIKNTYCFVCTRAENLKKEPKEHMCFKNWSKTSC